MNIQKWTESRVVQWGVLIVSAAFALALFIWLAYRIDFEANWFAVDWKMKWPLMQGGRVQWSGDLSNPPWTVIFFLPLGFLPQRVGWAVMAFVTAAALVLAVPQSQTRKGKYVALILAAILSFPALRNYADGNIDGLLLLGLLLLIEGYRREKPIVLGLGILLATIKPQAVLLLVVILPLYLIQSKPASFYLKAGAFALAAAVVSFLLMNPRGWLEAVFGVTQRTYGIALSALLIPLNAPPAILWLLRAAIILITLAVAYFGDRTLTGPKIALLVAASLIVSPYSGALTLVVVVALGVIPLMITRPAIGYTLYALYTLPVFFFWRLPVPVQDTIWGGLLLIGWGVLAALLGKPLLDKANREPGDLDQNASHATRRC